MPDRDLENTPSGDDALCRWNGTRGFHADTDDELEADIQRLIRQRRARQRGFGGTDDNT